MAAEPAITPSIVLFGDGRDWHGKSLVRAANSGVSAFIDPLGRIAGTLAPMESGVLKGTPAQPLEKTLFAELRNIPFFVLSGLGFIVAFIGRRAARRPRT